MAQRIKIKRSSSATNPSNLKEGELAYIHSNDTGGNLYIGRPGTGDAQTGLCSSIDIVGGLIDHNKLDGISAGAEVNPDQVTASERTAGTVTDERSFSPADVKSMIDTHALTGLSAATSSAFGGVKLHDDSVQTTAPEDVSTTANRTYSVQLDANGKASVNVPWSDTNTQRAIHDSPVDGATTTSISSNWAFDNVKTAVPDNAVFTDTDTVYTLPTATSSALGGIELFSDSVQSTAANTVSTTANRTYGIQLNSDGQAVVNVPWATLDISSTPTNSAVTTAISSDWAFDNVKTAVPSGALFTDTTYTVGDGGLTQNNFTDADHTKLDNIDQGLATTDDVTFDDLTLTGNIQLDDSGEIKFSSEGLAYDESTNTITSTRIIFDEWDYDSYSVNELADIARAITKLSVASETMPDKYAHLFDMNDSGSFSAADTLQFLSNVQDAVSQSKYQSVTTAMSNSSNYATTIIADLKDGDYDVASVSDGSISLGSSSSRFKHLNLSGDATIGGDLDVEGTISIGDIVTQSNTTPVIKLKDTTANTSNDGDDFKIAVNLNEFAITQHTDLDEAGDTSLTLLKGKTNSAGDGVQMAINGNYDGTKALTVTGDVGCSGNLTALGTVNLGAAAVAASGDDPAIPAKHTTVKANLTVDGDLTVSGTTTTINTETIELADNIIELNSNVTGNSAIGTAGLNAGLTVNRGSGTTTGGATIYDSELRWSETSGEWTVTEAFYTPYALLHTGNFEDKITEIDGGTSF